MKIRTKKKPEDESTRFDMGVEGKVLFCSIVKEKKKQLRSKKKKSELPIFASLKD